MWGIHRDRWIPRTKGQLRGKCFHLMTPSCIAKICLNCRRGHLFFILGSPIDAFSTPKKHHIDFLICICGEMYNVNGLQTWQFPCSVQTFFFFRLHICLHTYIWMVSLDILMPCRFICLFPHPKIISNQTLYSHTPQNKKWLILIQNHILHSRF